MKVVATEKAPKALGPYSQGYVHNDNLNFGTLTTYDRGRDHRGTGRPGVQELGRSVRGSRHFL